MTRTIKTALLDHKKIAEEMKKSALSQEKIAELLGISDRHVRNLKTKDCLVFVPLLYRIHILFDKPMEYFLIVTEED